MGVPAVSHDSTMEQVFNELDEDGGGDISLEELKAFLKRIFILQRDEIMKVMRR